MVVGVVTDSGCEAYKGFRPAQYDRHRMRMIERLSWVDVVELQRGTDPSELLERYRPDVMTHGDDWKELREGQETIERLGIEWVLIPYTAGISSTALIAAAMMVSSPATTSPAAKTNGSESILLTRMVYDVVTV